MVAVHAWGYRLYRQQYLPVARIDPGKEADAQGDDRVLLEYASAGQKAENAGASFGFIVAQQSVAGLFTSIILDGGSLFKLCIASIAIYWFAALLGFLTHRRVTPVDRTLMHVGFWPLMFIVIVAAHVVWAIKGL
jgi:hypothetical protein